MTVISARVFRPLPGRAEVAMGRIKRLGEILTRLGGRARICSVAWGDGAREIHLYGVFRNMETGANASAALMADPEAARLQAEAAKEPASEWEGPEVWRTVYGEPQAQFPVLMQREYQIDRRHLKRMVELCPEVEALQDRPIVGVVPVTSGDMARFMVVYYASSLADMGERIDRIGMSEAFQSLVVRAAEFGKLVKSRVLVSV